MFGFPGFSSAYLSAQGPLALYNCEVMRPRIYRGVVSCMLCNSFGIYIFSGFHAVSFLFILLSSSPPGGLSSLGVPFLGAEEMTTVTLMIVRESWH